MHIIYRTSEAGYLKKKPAYINNTACLLNARNEFDKSVWHVIADNVSEETKKFLNTLNLDISHVSVGNGARTFNMALDIALKLPSEEIVYFLENDYLHRSNSQNVLESAFELPIHYATLYDHPDKYKDPMDGGNDMCKGGSEVTRVMLGKYCHWKLTNSTTMTFASKVRTLAEDERILRKRTEGIHPMDVLMFRDLAKKGRLLASPIPSFSTHGEVKWLAPLVDWEQIAENK